MPSQGVRHPLKFAGSEGLVSRLDAFPKVIRNKRKVCLLNRGLVGIPVGIPIFQTGASLDSLCRLKCLVLLQNGNAGSDQCIATFIFVAGDN